MVILAELLAKPETQAEIMAILDGLIVETEKEPGSVAYLVQQEAANPCRFVVYEIYQDAAAVQAHMDSSYLQAALARFATLLAEAPRLLTLNDPAGFGIAR